MKNKRARGGSKAMETNKLVVLAMQYAQHDIYDVTLHDGGKALYCFQRCRRKRDYHRLITFAHTFPFNAVDLITELNFYTILVSFNGHFIFTPCFIPARALQIYITLLGHINQRRAHKTRYK